MGVQRVSKKDLIDEYLHRPPHPEIPIRPLVSYAATSVLYGVFYLNFKFDNKIYSENVSTQADNLFCFADLQGNLYGLCVQCIVYTGLCTALYKQTV